MDSTTHSYRTRIRKNWTRNWNGGLPDSQAIPFYPSKPSPLAKKFLLSWKKKNRCAARRNRFWNVSCLGKNFACAKGGKKKRGKKEEERWKRGEKRGRDDRGATISSDITINGIVSNHGATNHNTSSNSSWLGNGNTWDSVRATLKEQRASNGNRAEGGRGGGGWSIPRRWT